MVKEALSKEVNLSYHLKDEEEPVTWKESEQNKSLLHLCLKWSFPRYSSHIMNSNLRPINPGMCQAALSIYLKLSHTRLINSNPPIPSSTLEPLPKFSFCYISTTDSGMTISHHVQVRNLGDFYCSSPPLAIFLPHYVQTLWALSTVSPQYFNSLSISVNFGCYCHILGLDHM